MKMVRALIFIWMIVLFAWMLLIGIVKIVESLILPIPNSVLRSILGIVAYFIWIAVLIGATKLLYKKAASSTT